MAKKQVPISLSREVLDLGRKRIRRNEALIVEGISRFVLSLYKYRHLFWHRYYTTDGKPQYQVYMTLRHTLYDFWFIVVSQYATFPVQPHEYRYHPRGGPRPKNCPGGVFLSSAVAPSNSSHSVQRSCFAFLHIGLTLVSLLILFVCLVKFLVSESIVYLSNSLSDSTQLFELRVPPLVCVKGGLCYLNSLDGP